MNGCAGNPAGAPLFEMRCRPICISVGDRERERPDISRQARRLMFDGFPLAPDIKTQMAYIKENDVKIHDVFVPKMPDGLVVLLPTYSGPMECKPTVPHDSFEDLLLPIQINGRNAQEISESIFQGVKRLSEGKGSPVKVVTSVAVLWNYESPGEGTAEIGITNAPPESGFKYF